jgi:hypothetical protein
MSLWFFYQIPFIFPAAAREGNSSTKPCTPARSAFPMRIIPKFRDFGGTKLKKELLVPSGP